MNNGSSSISLSPLTSSEVRNNPYPAPLNSGRIGDFFAFFYKTCGVSRHRYLDQRGVLYAAFGVRETMGFVKNRREDVFPKVDTPYGQAPVRLEG